MKRILHIITILFISNYLFAQCNIDFGSNAGKIMGLVTLSSGNIVQNTTNSSERTSTQSFNIWDETSNPPNCNVSGGVNDITIDFNIIETTDAYGGSIKNLNVGEAHNIAQSNTGFVGSNKLGGTNNSTTCSSTGDYRGYSIKVTFASHVDISASEFAVKYTSGNTAGTAFESSALLFLDENGNPFGTATYQGYYTQAAIVSACPSTTIPGTVRPSPWSLSGNGVFAAQSTGTTGPAVGPDYCSSMNGTNGSDNGTSSPKTITATSTNISSSTKIGGFIFMTYLEDIRANINDNTCTTTSTTFTSTLNGFNVTNSPFSIDLISFDAKNIGKSNQLTWVTASEKDNVKFEIERSADGYQFEKIGEVAGKLNSTSIQSYSFIDENPLYGLNYYRLKNVDIIGRTDYSIIKSANQISRNVIIKPTMVSSNVEVDIYGMESPNMNIINLDGKIVIPNIECNSGKNRINVDNLPSGIYFLYIKSIDNQSIIEKIVKI